MPSCASSINAGCRLPTVGASAAFIVALTGLSFGCAAPETPHQPSPPPPPLAVVAPPPAVDEDAVRKLLDAAQQALADDRLTTPAEHSAYGYYRQILDLAPAHPVASQGLERIVERYIALARRAIEYERWPSAQTLLQRASLVDDAHPGIEPLRRQVELLARAVRLALAVERPALRRRSGELARRLANFGRQARRANARVTIRVGNDADGRWIYEQLNRAPGDRRIRAGIEIGLPPKVTILLLPGEGDG